jgi:hypothetical protein
MDDPADDPLQPGAQREQAPVDGCTIVRRTEITVQREITTIVVRRRNESAGPAAAQAPANPDGNDNP